jgi:flagellar FliJ protein
VARFAFRLDGVLRARKYQEQQRQRELAAALGELTGLEAEWRQINQTAETSVNDLRNNHLVGKIDVTFLTAHRRYMLAVQRKSNAIAQKMTVARKQVDDARAKLGEAAKQRKMLEKLREKQQTAWKFDQAGREFAELDDIGMRLALRGADGADVPATGEDVT